ncbi:MAG: DUF2905 domain-containing protein [Candidatus Omnitrophica bacterium]|nr:DUF2905 domain-containing protein [Candidatus Omnitrophota bacterium]
MNELSRIFFALGLFFTGLGGLFFLINRIPGSGKMPGDIVIKREDFTLYFPIMSCIIISIILSLVMYFTNKE